MSPLAFAWISSFMYGWIIILTKLTSKYAIKNEFLFNFLYAASILVWTIPVALINHAGIPKHWENIVATGICYAFSGTLYVLAIYKLDVSTVSPLYNLQTAFAVILAAIILHQTLTPLQYALVTLIFLAGLFTAVDEKFQIRSFFQWPVFIIVGGTFFLGLGGIFTNKALSQNDYWTVSLWIPIVTQTLFLTTIPLFRKDITKEVRIKPISALLLVGFCDMAGVLTANRAYSGNVGLAAVIISLPISLLLVITLSIFWPKLLEKHTFKVYAIRVTAAIIMVAAALKLSL